MIEDPKREASVLVSPTHRSPTQHSILRDCEMKYFYRYVKRLPEQRSGALVLGSATDAGLQRTFTVKKRTGRDERLSVVQEVYVAEFDGQKGEVDWGQEGEQPDALRDAGLGPLGKYHREECPSIRPAEIQPDLTMTSKALGIKIVQYGDVITADGGVIDNKTSKASPSSDGAGGYRPKSLSHELQMVSQGLGYEARAKKRPRFVRLDYLIHTKEAKVVKVPVVLTSERIALYEALADRLERRLQWLNATAWAGALPNRESRLCSRRYCSFWKQCQADFGGMVKE